MGTIGKAGSGAGGCKAYHWDCGVPAVNCTATAKTFDSKHRMHGSRDDAVQCGKRWARAINAERAEGDPVLLPPSPSRLKKGKGGRVMSPRIRG